MRAGDMPHGGDQGDEDKAEGQRHRERVEGRSHGRARQYGRDGHGGTRIDQDESTHDLGHRRTRHVGADIAPV